MSALDPESLAAQLRSPHGPQAQAVGELMSKGNGRMYELFFRDFHPGPDEQVLEVGCGNGWFVDRFIGIDKLVRYQGIELSREMVAAAQQRINSLGLSDRARVEQADILHWPGQPVYSHVVAINLLYFFDDPAALVQRLAGFLAPGGRLSLGIRTGSTMRQLPFTRFGFNLYEPEEVQELLSRAGLTDLRIIVEDELLSMPFGQFRLTNALISGAREDR